MLFILGTIGTMHLAAAVKVPCVAVFSAREDPGLWYPYGNEHKVFRSAIDCEGCMLQECIRRGNECIKRIDASEVFEASCKILGRLIERKSLSSANFSFVN